MENYDVIKKDRQITKFCYYGFFKSLRFFEPYLLIYLTQRGFSLLEIGFLLTIRAGFTYVFEVPSAFISNRYGMKNELLLCFTFYIISFIIYFFGATFFVIAIGMAFFGLGEAFRSGTHKGMILLYLEKKGWFEHKGFVYGRTRSYSMLGASLSALLSIGFVIWVPDLKWVFILTIIPYILDFILIMTYPSYMNERVGDDKDLSLFSISIGQVIDIAKNKNILKMLMSSATYDGTFKAIKDYIQPILSLILLSAGTATVMNLSGDDTLKVYLGILYGIFYILSSIASRQVYKLSLKLGQKNAFEYTYILMGILLLGLSLSIKNNHILPIMIIYMFIYLLGNVRRNFFLELAADHMAKEQRVTILSIRSQLKVIVMMVLSPIFGYIADHYSISALFVVIGLGLCALHFVLKIRPVQDER